MNSRYTALFIIVSIFLLVGYVTPYIHAEFNQNAATTDVSEFQSDIGDLDASGGVGISTLTGSILSMFFWTFGALPMWLDLIFVILRIILAVIVYELIMELVPG